MYHFLVGLLKFWEAVLIDVGTLLAVIMNGTRPLAFTGYSDSLDYVPAKALSFYDYMRSMSMSMSGYGIVPHSTFTPLLIDEEAECQDNVDDSEDYFGAGGRPGDGHLLASHRNFESKV